MQRLTRDRPGLEPTGEELPVELLAALLLANAAALVAAVAAPGACGPGALLRLVTALA